MSIIRPVKPKPGWELIPNHFAEDPSLSEDAVAVGLWLAVKPEGWEVRPAAIQTAFSRRPGKPRGREWWARVSTELRQANYLRLSRIHGDGGKFSSAWDFNVFGFGDDVAGSGSAVVGSAGIGLANAGSAPLYNQHSADSILTTTHHQPVVDGIEDLIEAGVWAEGLTRPIKNEAGLRRKIRSRLLSDGPNAEDLHALRAWRAHQEREVTDRTARERELAACTAREQERATQVAEASAYLQSLDSAAHATLVEAFTAHLERTNGQAYQFYRRQGLRPKIVETALLAFVASNYLSRNRQEAAG